MSDQKPTWSIMIPTYEGNPEYIRETIRSVLTEDMGPDKMQITLVDNGSVKNDFKALVEEEGKGRVEYYRHPETIKYLDNFNSCIDMARGEYVHLLHDDDTVEPGFYTKVEAAFTLHPEIGYAFTRHKFMNQDGKVFTLSPLEKKQPGILEDWVDVIATKQSIYYASVVVPKSVYLREGSFNNTFNTCAEDWEMWVRLATKYPVYYIPEPLASVRIHSNSMSKSLFQSGALISESRKAIETFSSLLPEEKRSKLSKAAKEHIANVGISYANSFAGSGQTKVAITLAQEAVKTTLSPKVFFKLLETSARIGLSIFRKHGGQFSFGG